MTLGEVSLLRFGLLVGEFFGSLYTSKPEVLGFLGIVVNILYLVGGWTNPSEKYARQIGNIPQIGMKIKHVWNHHQVILGYENKHDSCLW